MNDYEEDYDDAYGTAGCQPECLLTKENREDDGTKVLVAYLVSQAFRSRAGAESFAVLHSVMDTAKKNGMPIFQAVRAVVEYQPIALHE